MKERVINGKKQSFEIIEDLLNNNTIIFRVVGVEKKYHYTDEDSFKSCIQQIEDYMENAADQVIFIIKCDDGSTKYVPDVEEFILDVDMDENTVLVHLIEGM